MTKKPQPKPKPTKPERAGEDYSPPLWHLGWNLSDGLYPAEPRYRNEPQNPRDLDYIKDALENTD